MPKKQEIVYCLHMIFPEKMLGNNSIKYNKSSTQDIVL